MSLSRGATALLQLLLGMPSVLQAASKDLHAAEESPGGMPANTLLRRRGVAGRRRGHEVRNARTRLSPREETTYKAHSSHWAAGGGGVIDAGESAVGIGVVFAGRSGLLPENAPVTPLSLDACFRRLRSGVILLRVLSTSTVAGVSTSCCWALASGVSVGRGDSAIAGCPLRSQPPPPMQ